MSQEKFELDARHQRSHLREVETALRREYPITDEMRAAIAGTMAQLLVGRDSAGNPVKTDGRTKIAACRVLAMLDRINIEREKMQDIGDLVRVPITPEQLAAMSDEELDSFHANIKRACRPRPGGNR